MALINGQKMKMSIPHSLAFEEVKTRFQEQLLQRLENTFPQVHITNLQQMWKKDHSGKFSCEVGGHGVAGVMRFQSGQLDLVVQLPFGASTRINVESTQRALKTSLTKMLN